MAAVTTDPAGGYLRELLGLQLTEEQLAVVTHPLAPQLVVAGAGSGKTGVVAARVVHLVAHHAVPASAVLGLTFTNKAAGELATRVRQALRKLAEQRGQGGLEDDLPTVSTYHAYAAGVVRDHALRIGREPQTTLLTEATRWQLAMRVVRAAAGPFLHLPWAPATVANRLLALDGELAEHLRSIDDLRAYDADLIARALALPARDKDLQTCLEAAHAREELLTLVAAYRDAKRDLDLLDFGDQVALAAEIAVAPDVARLERARFAVVLLDEYQDTGYAQRRLLQHLYGDGHPVTAVGDPTQAIYGWRGASVGNLLGFPDHFPPTTGRVETQPLMTSFRCAERILEVANAVAAPLRESARARGRRWLDVRPLSAAPATSPAGEVVVSLHDDAEEEAAHVAESVVAAHGDTAWGEIAVLCRRRADFALLHRALTDAGVPAEVVGLGGLLTMPEVADVVAVLDVLADPVANPALVRLLTGPRWRLGPRDLAALGHRAHRLTRYGPHDDDVAEEQAAPRVTDPLVKATDSVDPVDVASLVDAVESPGPAERYSPAALDRLAELRAELRELRLLVGQPIVETVATVIRRTGLGVEAECDSPERAAARMANLAAFLDHAAHFTGLAGESDLRSFLAYLRAAEQEEDGLDAGGISSADTVKLLTIHKAKGLEWDVVVLPALTAEIFPSSMRRPRPTRAAHVLPYSLRGDADDLPRDPALDKAQFAEFRSDCTADDADEERRLAYVAITRARRRVVASGSWWTGTRASRQGASSLLEELHALPGVRVSSWVGAEEASVANPLLAAARTDVPWPREFDPAAVESRREAAGLVRTAMAEAGATTLPFGEDVAATLTAAWSGQASVLLEELRRQRSAVRTVALPRRLTASQVVALAQDPAGLARALARPMPAAPVRQARRGTRFHAWVESRFGDRPLLAPDELPGAADGPDLDDAELADLQRRFLASPWGERRPVAIEAPFELVVGGRLLRGRIDAVYETAAGYDVVDYKTGEVPADFVAASLQLTIYRLAWAGLRGVDPACVTAGFLYVKTGELKRPDHLLDETELAALLAGTPHPPR